MSRRLLFNGAGYTKPVQCGPVVPVYDNETRSMLFRVPYKQRAAFFTKCVIGSKGINGSFLVEESEAIPVGVAGLVQFNRLFAQKPSNRSESESYGYQYQFLEDGQLVALPIPTNSRLFFEYFHTADPMTIPLLKAHRYVQVGSLIFEMGTAPPGLATEILAEDSSVRRWRGNFWERRSRWVRVATITTA